MKTAFMQRLLPCIALTGVLLTPVTYADELPTLPAAKAQNGVNYLSGGVGEGQAVAMKLAAANYSTMLTFAEPSGAYLADVKVLIQDSKGATILDTVSEGPMLLVDLPPGQYRVAAEYKGNTQSQPLSVKGKGAARLTLRWPG